MLSGLLLAAMASPVNIPQIRLTRSGSTVELRLGSGSVFRKTKSTVSQPKTFRLVDGSIVGFWKEGNVDRFLVSKNGELVLREAQSDVLVHLKAGTFDPLKATPAPIQAIPTPEDNEIYIVQFKSQPLPTYLDELASLGATCYDTVAPNAAIVRVPASTLESVRALSYVRWAGAYEAAYRLDPNLKKPLATNTLGTHRYNIWCHQRGPAMQDAVASRVRLLGGQVDQLIPQGFMLSATLSPLQLVQVLGMNEVSYVDAWSEGEQDMDVVRASGGANFIETTLGFTGQGVRAEVMDGGLRTTHQAWTNAPLQHAPSMVVDSHGTSTFGINFGNGAANTAGRGMLPSAQGVIGRYSAMSGGNRYTHTAELLASPYFCVYQSNSWGDTQTTAYTTISAQMDDILFLNDITILNSQSNTGNQTSRPQAWAKNVVSIGAVYHFGTAATTDDRWNAGASIGPAADGRYKPELAHFYDSILCPTSTSDTAYTTGFGGTSAATPITAGHFGLYFQMWHNGVFGNPAPATTVFENRPKATLAKAIMMNTAFQYPLGPQQADITRFVQGFGKVDLTNLYGVRNNLFWINETDVLQNLETATHKVLVGAGTPALRFTMAYTDPQGTPGAALARKNNLSLKVTAPNGTTFWWGNSGMTTSNWTTSGGVEDTINTVESVYIQNPTAGVYTVQVIGSDINTDARPETPGVIDADYALIGTGVTNMNLAPSAFSVDDSGLVSGTLSDLALSDNSVVTATRGVTGSRDYRSIVNLTYTSPSTTASKMTFTLERRNPTVGVTEVVQAYEVGTGLWIPIGTGTVPQADGLNVISISNPQRFVSGTGEIKLKCTFNRQDTFTGRTGNMSLDYARLMVEP